MTELDQGALDQATQQRLGRRAKMLAGFSVTYNVVEAVIAIAAGLVAGSVALVGFGLDSVVEVSSGLVILWQFSHRVPASRERQALRMLAVSFFALAAYVGFESVRSLVVGADPDASPIGIALAAVSLVVMPFISLAQRRTGRALGSDAVYADGTQTLLCTHLSAVLLVGLLLNATLGWSWADPVAGLAIAVVAAREGVQAWRGDGCCSAIVSTPSHHGTETDTSDADCGCTDCQDACCAPAAEPEVLHLTTTDRSL